jgi:hypothetical protein
MLIHEMATNPKGKSQPYADMLKKRDVELEGVKKRYPNNTPFPPSSLRRS